MGFGVLCHQLCCYVNSSICYFAFVISTTWLFVGMAFALIHVCLCLWYWGAWLLVVGSAFFFLTSYVRNSELLWYEKLESSINKLIRFGIGMGRHIS